MASMFFLMLFDAFRVISWRSEVKHSHHTVHPKLSHASQKEPRCAVREAGSSQGETSLVHPFPIPLTLRPSFLKTPKNNVFPKKLVFEMLLAIANCPGFFE